MAEQSTYVDRALDLGDYYRRVKSGMYEAFRAEIRGLEQTVEKALKGGNFEEAYAQIKRYEDKYLPKPPQAVEAVRTEGREPKLREVKGYIREAVRMYRNEHPKGGVTVADVIRYIRNKIPSVDRVPPAAVANALKGLGLKKRMRKGKGFYV